MKSYVLNADRLHLTDEQMTLLNKRAELHQRYSAIEFKVLENEDDKAVIRVIQEKSFSGNYFNANRLVEIVHETFDDLLPGIRILVRPIPYKPSPPDVVTPGWLKKKIEQEGWKLKGLSEKLGIDANTLSAYRSGKKPMSGVVRAMFYKFFESERSKDAIDVFALLKIGEMVHMEALYKKGEIYMQSLDEFRKFDGNGKRKDENEGLQYTEEVNMVKIKLPGGKFLELNTKSEKMRLRDARLKMYDKTKDGNIYSLVAVTSNLLDRTDRLDEENIKLGDTFVIIREPKEFMMRIEGKLRELGYIPEHRMVKYYDQTTTNGSLGVFHKPDNFEHQNEYRVFINRMETDPLKFNIGSIEDISDMFDIKALPQLRFKME